MTAEEVNAKLMEIVNEYTGLEEDEISDDLSIRGDFALNSFQVIALIGSIEDTFGIKISETDMMNFDLFGDVRQYIADAAIGK